MVEMSGNNGSSTGGAITRPFRMLTFAVIIQVITIEEHDYLNLPSDRTYATESSTSFLISV